MRLRSCAVLTLALGAPALACSLAISTDGLAGPPLEPDAAGPEVGADAAGDEASADADAADTGPFRFCDLDPTATFCADFDHGSDPEAGFTDELTLGGHMLGLSNNAVSAPNALSVEVASNPSGETSARLYRDLGFVARTVHLEMDVNICPVKKGTLELLKIETSSAGIHSVAVGYEGADVALDLRDGSAAMTLEYYDPTNGNVSNGFPLSSPLPLGTWTHLAFDVVFAQDPSGAVSLFVDHGASPAVALANTRTLSTGPTAMRVLIGVYAFQSADDCTTLFDNLVVRAQP